MRDKKRINCKRCGRLSAIAARRAEIDCLCGACHLIVNQQDLPMERPEVYAAPDVWPTIQVWHITDERGVTAPQIGIQLELFD